MDVLITYTRREQIKAFSQLHRLLETRGPIGDPIIEYATCYDLLLDIQRHLDENTCRCSPDEGIACGVQPTADGYCDLSEED